MRDFKRIYDEKYIRSIGRSMEDVTSIIKEQPDLIDKKFEVSDLTPIVYQADDKKIQLLNVNSADTYNLHPNATQQLYLKSHFPSSMEFRSNIKVSTMQTVINDLWQNVICRVPKRGEKKKLLLRMNKNDETVVAFLSERYNPYDNKDLIDSLNGGLGEVAWEKVVTNFYCQDYRLGMRIAFPGHGFKSPEGDMLWPSLFVRNDETGNGAVHCHHAIFHIRNNAGFIALHHFEAQKAYHTKSYMDAVSMVRKACRDMPEFTRTFIADVTKATKSPIPEFASIKEVQEYLGQLEVKKEEAKGILEYLNYVITDRDSRNKWTLSKAISYVAQDFDYDRHIELEQLATKILVRKY